MTHLHAQPAQSAREFDELALELLSQHRVAAATALSPPEELTWVVALGYERLFRDCLLTIAGPAKGLASTPVGASTTLGIELTAARAVTATPGFTRSEGDCSKYSSKHILGRPSTRMTMPP